MSYSIKQFSKFRHQYKKARKKYKHNFDDDFNALKKFLQGKIADSFIDHDPRKMPKTDVISGLGQDVEHPICKTRMMITDAQSQIGRVIWLHDQVNMQIFLIDIYHKNQRSNHSVPRIRKAYAEYLDDHMS